MPLNFQQNFVGTYILYSEMFDGLLEESSKTEGEKIIVQQFRKEKVAA